MQILRHRQTIVPQALGVLRLPVSKVRGTSADLVSPYFRLLESAHRKVGIGRDIRIIPEIMALNKVIYSPEPQYDGNTHLFVVANFMDSSTNLVVDSAILTLSATAISGVTDEATLKAAVVAAISAYITSAGYTITTWIESSAVLSDIPAAPTSYQTIVSQTGTAAPTVSGGFAPPNTYPAGTTFTWARTSAGVYTLTASSAVFNTSKTGVFVAPLQNLNASVRAVVTSTTVITVTTAVQSVAVLGLLGLTTTATDALLSGTMIYVQTYS